MLELTGLKVDKVLINADKDVLGFVCGEKITWASATGDCCSTSWFEHINGLDALIGETINKVIEREMPEAERPDDFDVTQFYGWTLETNKGRCDVEMRNHSNGYYGGSVEIGDTPLSQYRDKLEIPETKELKEDF